MNSVLGSPEGLVLSRFIVDIAGVSRLGLTDNITTNGYSQPERGRNNPFDARLHCGVDEYLFSQHEFSSLPYSIETVEPAHLCKLIEFKVLPSGDD